MALLSNDLFFVNRSNITYKIKASEIGDFVLGDSANGVPGYIQDGALSVKGGSVNKEIHSANTAADTVLKFDDNFSLINELNGVCVGIDYEYFKNGLICDSDSGFLENNCGCLAIDLDWIADNLGCPGGGLINNGGCIILDFDAILDNILCDNIDSGLINVDGCLIVDVNLGGGIIIGDDGLEINLCANGGISHGPDGCLQVDIKPGGGIINEGNGLEINIDSNGGGGIIINPGNGEIELNICSSNSGLELDSTSGCLSVDFDQVTGNINICPDGGLSIETDGSGNNCLSVINGDNTIIGGGGGSCSLDSDCPDNYRCLGNICYPDPSKWPEGALWWHNDEVDGRLYINYKTGDTYQWVDASPRSGANASI